MNDRELLELIREICTPAQFDACRLQAAGYGVRRIGRILGISPAAVRCRLDAAELRVRRHLEEAG